MISSHYDTNFMHFIMNRMKSVNFFSLIFSVVLVMCWLRMTDWGVRFNEAEELAIPHGHFTNYTVGWVCNSLPFKLLLFRTITTGVLCGEGEGEFLSNAIFVFIIKFIYLVIYLIIQVLRGVMCTSLKTVCFCVVNENEGLLISGLSLIGESWGFFLIQKWEIKNYTRPTINNPSSNHS